MADELLLPGVGSVMADVTLAELMIDVPTGVPATTCATRVIVAVPAFAIVPRLQVTVVVPLHVPWDGVAETKVRVEGSVSVTVEVVAEAGPALVTVIV